MSSSLYGGANLQTDSDMPSDTSGAGAGDTQTVYYTAGTNPIAAACGNKPEWANLTCQTGPAAQPGTAGLPNLPVTTYTYDDYLNVLTKTETFGTAGTRTTTTGYDADERPVTQTIAVTGTGMGTAVPETQTVYSANTGLPTDTQTLGSTGTVTADINTTYDDFGNTLTYTDASGDTATYTYNSAGEVASRADRDLQPRRQPRHRDLPRRHHRHLHLRPHRNRHLRLLRRHIVDRSAHRRKRPGRSGRLGHRGHHRHRDPLVQ